MDIKKYSKDNSGHAFILVVIDIFSKFIWMLPLKDEKGESVSRAFTDILTEGRRPTRLRTDKGQDFRSRVFNDLLKDQNIEHLYAQNTEIKANYAERVIKTTKARITRYMTYKRSYRYIDHLGDFNDNYNSTFHRTIGMAPEKVTKSKETKLWWKMYWPKKKHQSYRRRNALGNPSSSKLQIKSERLISEPFLPENMTRNGLEKSLLYRRDVWGEDYLSINSKTIWTK